MNKSEPEQNWPETVQTKPTLFVKEINNPHKFFNIILLSIKSWKISLAMSAFSNGTDSSISSISCECFLIQAGLSLSMAEICSYNSHQEGSLLKHMCFLNCTLIKPIILQPERPWIALQWHTGSRFYQTQACSTGAVLQFHHMVKISVQAYASWFQSLWLSKIHCPSSVHQMWQWFLSERNAVKH